MELKNKILSLLNKSFIELQEYTKLYNTLEVNQRSKLVKESKVQFQKDPKSVNIEELARDLFYIKGFHQLDIRNLQVRFFNTYELYKKLELSETIDQELIDTAEFLKDKLGKQTFTVESSEFRELVKGSLEEAVIKYKENNYFKLFEKQLMALLND